MHNLTAAEPFNPAAHRVCKSSIKQSNFLPSPRPNPAPFPPRCEKKANSPHHDCHNFCIKCCFILQWRVRPRFGQQVKLLMMNYIFAHRGCMRIKLGGALKSCQKKMVAFPKTVAIQRW